MARPMETDAALEIRSQRVAVVMQRRSVDSPWQSEVWEPLGVLPGYDATWARARSTASRARRP